MPSIRWSSSSSTAMPITTASKSHRTNFKTRSCGECGCEVIQMRWLNAVLACMALAAGLKIAGEFSSARAGEADGPVIVKVRAEVLHRIDSRLFGQFMERPSWGGEIGAEVAILPGMRRLHPGAKRLISEMQIPVARFPGGTDVDYVDWQDMVDSVPGRSAERPLTVGHTGNKVTNRFGYDEFLRLSEELGMQSIVVVNFRDGLLGERGPEEGARHAARLAAYCNATVDADLPDELAAWPRLRAKNRHPAPYGVKYFQIGNETWAFLKEASRERYISTLERYIDEIRGVDPGVKIIVDGQPADLAAQLHSRLGERIDYFAVHHYQPWRIKQVVRGREPVPVSLRSCPADTSARAIGSNAASSCSMNVRWISGDSLSTRKARLFAIASSTACSTDSSTGPSGGRSAGSVAGAGLRRVARPIAPRSSGGGTSGRQASFDVVQETTPIDAKASTGDHMYGNELRLMPSSLSSGPTGPGGDPRPCGVGLARTASRPPAR